MCPTSIAIVQKKMKDSNSVRADDIYSILYSGEIVFYTLVRS